MPRGGSLDVAPPLCSGRYRLVAVLGSGGMATVYRAYDALLDVFRAVKVLDPELTQRRKTRERFLMEARTMAKLSHESVVAVYDMGVDGDRVYMLMELIDGGSLMERIDSHGPLPPRMACKVLIRVLEALEASHQIGVIHRDVKPHNVLLTLEGQPKVTDFGIASVHDADHNLTRTGAVMGTWAYMAPEQRKNAKQVDSRADVYAAGATLFALVTGVEPLDLYVPDSHDEALGGLLPPLVDLIRTSTRYKPDERYASARDFRDAIAARLSDLPADPPDASPLSVPGSMLPKYLRPETTDFDTSLRTDSVDKAAGVTTSRTARGSDRTFSLADESEIVQVDVTRSQRARGTPSAEVIRVDKVPAAPRPQAPQAVTGHNAPKSATPPPVEESEWVAQDWADDAKPPAATVTPADTAATSAPADENWLYAMASATPATTLSASRPVPLAPVADPAADAPITWTPPAADRGFAPGTHAPGSGVAVQGVSATIKAGLHQVTVVPQGLRITRHGLGFLLPGRPRVTLISVAPGGEVYRTNLGGAKTGTGAMAASPLVKETASSVVNALTRRDGSSVGGPRSLAGLAATVALMALLIRVFAPGLPYEFFSEDPKTSADMLALAGQVATAGIAFAGVAALFVPWWLAGRWVSSLRVLFYDISPERAPAWTAVETILAEIAVTGVEVVHPEKGNKSRTVRLNRALPAGFATNVSVWRFDVRDARLYVLPDMLLVWKERRLRVLRWKEVELIGDANSGSFDLDPQLAQKGPSQIEMRLRAKGLDLLLKSTSSAMAQLPGALSDLGTAGRDGFTG